MTQLQQADQSVFKQLFIHHLNRLYFGKTYLHRHMPYLTDLASFKALKLGLQEFGGDVEKQIARMSEIYQMLNEKPIEDNCNPLKAIVRDSFSLNEEQGFQQLVDTDIMLYVQMLEHINITVYRMLKLIAQKLNYTQIMQMLIESFDESVDNDQLFKLIATEHVGADHEE